MTCPPPCDGMDRSPPGPTSPLPKAHAPVLARWSLGLVLARSCALTAVRAFLAPWLGRQEQTGRPQWRECSEAAAKRGTARGALRVERCVVPRRAWA